MLHFICFEHPRVLLGLLCTLLHKNIRIVNISFHLTAFSVFEVDEDEILFEYSSSLNIVEICPGKEKITYNPTHHTQQKMS